MVYTDIKKNKKERNENKWREKLGGTFGPFFRIDWDHKKIDLKENKKRYSKVTRSNKFKKKKWMKEKEREEYRNLCAFRMRETGGHLNRSHSKLYENKKKEKKYRLKY